MMHTMHRARPATRERDYINKYEHIGLREGMHNAREKWNRTFNVDQGKSQCITINVAKLLFLLREIRANFNHAFCNEIQFGNGSSFAKMYLPVLSFISPLYADLILTLETWKRSFIRTRFTFDQCRTEKNGMHFTFTQRIFTH